MARVRRVQLAQPPIGGRDFLRLMDGQLKERQWQQQVERALDAQGWWYIHVPSNVVICPGCRRRIYRGIRKGFPDILAIRPPDILWIELKTTTGSLDRHQRHVRDLLAACGQTFIRARPGDRQQLLAVIARVPNPEAAL